MSRIKQVLSAVVGLAVVLGLWTTDAGALAQQLISILLP